MCVNPAEWSGDERRRYTPVDLRHVGWGPRVAMLTLFLALIANIMVTGMAYQRLVDSTTDNEADIVSIRAVDVQLMRTINDMTRAMASLTTTVGHLADDVQQVEDELRGHRAATDRQ
jgi:hypothetical protein